jgi:hypothetical protein
MIFFIIFYFYPIKVIQLVGVPDGVCLMIYKSTYRKNIFFVLIKPLLSGLEVSEPLGILDN